MKSLLIISALFIYSGVKSQIIELDTVDFGYPIRNSILCASNDVIWIGSNTNGLTNYDNGIHTEFNTSNSGIASNRCNAISEDSSGMIWTGSDAGVSVFDGISWSVYNSTNSPLPSNTVNCITHTTNGAWIGTNNGLAYFDGVSWLIYQTGNSTILSDNITTLTAGNNIVYAGTASGISSIDNGIITNYTPQQTNLIIPVSQLGFASGILWSRSNYQFQFSTSGYFQSVDRIINDFSPDSMYYGSRLRIYAFHTDKSESPNAFKAFR